MERLKNFRFLYLFIYLFIYLLTTGVWFEDCSSYNANAQSYPVSSFKKFLLLKLRKHKKNLNHPNVLSRTERNFNCFTRIKAKEKLYF
jgi:hypothetical protein